MCVKSEVCCFAVDSKEKQRKEIMKLKRRFVKDRKLTSAFFAKSQSRKSIAREVRSVLYVLNAHQEKTETELVLPVDTCRYPILPVDTCRYITYVISEYANSSYFVGSYMIYQPEVV